MKKFKATCHLLNQVFYKNSDLDLTVAVAVKYLDKNGNEEIDVGWGTSTFRQATHGLLSKLNVSSVTDSKITALALCEVEEIS